MAEAGSLRGRSLPELLEMLRRQERLLADRKFISRLPDKGQKISAFAETLKVAIAQEEARRKRTELLSAVRLEFQKRQEEPGSGQHAAVASEDRSACEDLPLTSACHADKGLEKTVQDQPSVWATKTRTETEFGPAGQTHEDSGASHGEDRVSQASAASERPHRDPHSSVGRSSEALVEALEKISIVGRQHEEASGKESDMECNEDPFPGDPHWTPKTPHYMQVLDMRAKNPVEKKSTFKPNRIPAESSRSSGGSSEAPSPGGAVSAEERRRREKQHLDDVTAARLPPLHHAPAQLLSLGESIAIQVQQKAVYEETQAKLAAQKLVQKLGIKMVAYEPEGGAGGSYRERKAEDGYSSAED